MVTKGIIKSIDLLGNTCTVHIPFFETAGNDPIVETATISNTPGMYNGYKVGDAVYVAFEDGRMNTPVVIGKLYLGTEKEKADPRGVSNVEESTAAKKATLPADAKLAAEIDSSVPNTTVPYSSLSSIANGLNTLNTNVGQMDRDYGNRFKQVISNAEGLKSELEQTATNMVAKVSGYKTDENGKQIRTAFGWELQNDSWEVFNEKGTILKADENGLEVTGTVTATSGRFGGAEGFTIGTSKIYSGKNDSLDSSENGVYIGKDGISIGDGFKVETSDLGDGSYTTMTLSDKVSQQISAVTYWLSSSCVVHTGAKHGSNIVVTAMKKIGSKSEEIDEEAYIWYKYKTSSDEWACASENYRVTFLQQSQIPDDDILLIATHKADFDPKKSENLSTDPNIYEQEEITFSPLNTPVLDLTNDSAAIAYSGDSKLNDADTVESTATLYLNGSEISAGVTYNWTLTGCTAASSQVLTAKKLIVKDLSANTATAACTATYNGETYTKVFTITKQLKGEAGNPGDQGTPGRSVLSTIKYYTLATNQVGEVTKPPVSPEMISSGWYAWNDADYLNSGSSGWTNSPPAYKEDNWGNPGTYYESVCTIYDNEIINPDWNEWDDLPKTINEYSWSEPVQNSMLSVDFINSLGITTKKISVMADTDEYDSTTGKYKQEPVFEADGFATGPDGYSISPTITLGGWIIEKDGRGNWVSEGTTVTGINGGWVLRSKYPGPNRTFSVNNLFRFEYYTDGETAILYNSYNSNSFSPDGVTYSQSFTGQTYYYLGQNGLRFRITNGNFNQVKVHYDSSSGNYYICDFEVANLMGMSEVYFPYTSG